MRPVFRIFFPALLAALPLTAAPVESPSIVVTHASLWTPQGLQPNREILIREGRVVSVGTSGTVYRPADAKVIDAGGDTLLPGLIDAHVHLVMGTRLPADFPPDTVASATAKQLLRSGVTSGRIHLWDLPNAVKMKRDSAADVFPAPRLVVGGPALFGGQPDWNSPTGNVWGVKSPDDGVEKVRRLHAAGADWIALHSLGRFQTGEAEAIVSEARRLGLHLMVGGDNLAEIERGLEIGADSLEYQDRSEATAYPENLVKRLQAAKDRITLVPCLGFPYHFAAYRQGALRLDDPRLTEFLPPAAATFVAGAIAEDRTREIKWAPNDGTVPPAVASKFRQLHAAGLALATGTDCGSPMHFHADSIWWELETLRRLGLPPDECLRAATIIPARLLRQPDIGHLGPGARADFVLYRGRPDEGAFDVERVRAVGKGGVLYVEDGRWIAP